MENKDQNNCLKIALAFSGGGYRAACFSLGTLSYLDRYEIAGKSLLKHVVALSTVSGGTITGAVYAVGIKQGKDFKSIYSSLYSFIKDTDLVALPLDRLLSEEGWTYPRIKSLINAFADVYDEKLFQHAKFGILMTEDNPIHLKHISFNATEFSTAKQFRFQWSEKINNPNAGEPSRGIIGNYDFQIPENAAEEIRMADILAASSCFPGGFEPINFPTDFINSETKQLKALSEIQGYPVGLMDGGVVDNQGIEPILLAENRMKRNRLNPDEQGNVLDLIISSDVASPYMEDYVASIQQPLNGWRKLTPAIILLLNSVLLIGSLGLLYWSAKHGNLTLVIVTTSIATLSLVVFIMGKVLKELPVKFSIPEFFMKPLGKLLKLKLQVYETLIANRKNSMLKMINDVFLKHIRQLNYKRIYEDPTWINRRIMNAVYELRSGEQNFHDKIKSGALPAFLLPTPILQEVATQAASMGTTLWFTPEELDKKNMLNTLIACGQFTTCWNLLEYIGKLKDDSTNQTNNHRVLMELEDSFRNDWNSFNEDPYWMVNEINKIQPHI